MATTPSKNQTRVTAEPGKQELFIIREFDAAPDLLYRAFTDADLFVRWLGPTDMTMQLITFEPKSGGRWRYIHVDKAGNEFGFHGTYHEVSPTRMVQTFEFELVPGSVTLDTATFEALPNGRTKLVIHSVFQSVANRDGMVQSGMEGGLNEGFAKLDRLLLSLK